MVWLDDFKKGQPLPWLVGIHSLQFLQKVLNILHKQCKYAKSNEMFIIYQYLQASFRNRRYIMSVQPSGRD